MIGMIRQWMHRHCREKLIKLQRENHGLRDDNTDKFLAHKKTEDDMDVLRRARLSMAERYSQQCKITADLTTRLSEAEKKIEDLQSALKSKKTTKKDQEKIVEPMNVTISTTPWGKKIKKGQQILPRKDIDIDGAIKTCAKPCGAEECKEIL